MLTCPDARSRSSAAPKWHVMLDCIILRKFLYAAAAKEYEPTVSASSVDAEFEWCYKSQKIPRIPVKSCGATISPVLAIIITVIRSLASAILAISVTYRLGGLVEILGRVYIDLTIGAPLDRLANREGTGLAGQLA